MSDISSKEMPSWSRQPRRALVLSSSESLPVARAVQAELQAGNVESTVWDQSNFSGWLLNELIERIAEYVYVIVVLSTDDVTTSRGRETLSPRDNVVLELGMALAINGPSRTAVLCPDSPELHIPIDIDGLILKHYPIRVDQNHRAAVAPACVDILQGFANPKHGVLVMPPALYYRALDDLNSRIFRDRRNRTDIVIGVNHGGAILGGKLYYFNRQLFHFTIFWIDVHTELRTRRQRITDAKKDLEELLKRISESRGPNPNILLVDDTLRSGRAMVPAMEIVSELAPNASVRIACIIYRPDLAEYYNPERLQDIVITPDPRRFASSSFDRIFYEH